MRSLVWPERALLPFVLTNLLTRLYIMSNSSTAGYSLFDKNDIDMRMYSRDPLTMTIQAVDNDIAALISIGNTKPQITSFLHRIVDDYNFTMTENIFRITFQALLLNLTHYSSGAGASYETDVKISLKSTILFY
jgi:hypothetical protein